MPSRKRASSSPEDGNGAAVLIAAQSGRALAAAARRAGYVPLVADLFADADTRAIAADVERVPGGLSCGLRRVAVIAALEQLADRSPVAPIGVVAGPGFEDRPGHLAAIAARFALLGASGATVKRVKSPDGFAAACAARGLPHPALAMAGGGTGWLVKRRGGAGGSHVRPHGGGPAPAGHYLQAQVAGDPLSVTVVSDGSAAVSIGWCRQLVAPTPAQPFRFGGLVGGIAPPPPAAEIEAAARTLALDLGVVGLSSLDVIVGPGGWWVIELNPRPGASLDVLDGNGTENAVSLFGAHVAAVRGLGLPPPPVEGGSIRTSLVAFAGRPVRAVPAVDWPGWVADRPGTGDAIPAGAPIATALAAADTEQEAVALVRWRAAQIEEMVGGNPE
ncbi:ATP-grasp domain-containing protein [Methylobrevis albus]|uniref:ATP-grasp domain-containing protein n=1 Tax=Methylobrevis albus TaxID=2793297 RepID=A0A931I5K4_9HYPH|nr:ATP-grasp domain-containing protein [Methylobrevis albus]MBH0239630.1 ATP-grasp domain-containing protein [Methylobrevis albus]